MYSAAIEKPPRKMVNGAKSCEEAPRAKKEENDQVSLWQFKMTVSALSRQEKHFITELVGSSSEPSRSVTSEYTVLVRLFLQGLQRKLPSLL